jgi:hypothetical protein
MYFATESYGLDNTSIIFLPYFFSNYFILLKNYVPVAWGGGPLPSREKDNIDHIPRWQGNSYHGENKYFVSYKKYLAE